MKEVGALGLGYIVPVLGFIPPTMLNNSAILRLPRETIQSSNMYFLARLTGTIIIGRLHNFKTSALVTNEDRPFGTVGDMKLPAFSLAIEAMAATPEILVNAKRDRVLVEIIRHFETLGLPLSRDPNSNPSAPSFAAPDYQSSPTHARYNIPQKS